MDLLDLEISDQDQDDFLKWLYGPVGGGYEEGDIDGSAVYHMWSARVGATESGLATLYPLQQPGRENHALPNTRTSAKPDAEQGQSLV